MISTYKNFTEDKSDDEKLSDELNFYNQLNENLDFLQRKLFIKEFYDDLSSTRKKELLADIIHQIIVTPHVIKIMFKHPFFEVKEVRDDATI